MNCREIEIYAIEYLDGKLATQERQAVQLHLAGCSACGERLRGFSDVSAMLGTWESIEPSASFNSRLERRLASQPATAAGWWERLSTRLAMRLAWFPLGKPALAGAVLGVMLFGVILMRYYPASSGNMAQNPSDTPIVANMMDGNDELVPVLENLDLLSNFEVLQELKTTTP